MSTKRKGHYGHRTKGQRTADMARKRDERAKKAAARKKQQVLESYLADDENYSQFAQQLLKNGLGLRDIPADGNCLFRALGDQRDGHGRNHLHYRMEVVQYMYEHRKDFEPFVTDDQPFERYLSMLRKVGTYAGNDAIFAFAKLYRTNIVIHQLEQPLWQIKGTEAHGARELHISYHNGDHYSSVRKLGDDMECPTNLRTRDFKFVPQAPRPETPPQERVRPTPPPQQPPPQPPPPQQQQQQPQYQREPKPRKTKPVEKKLIDLENYKSLPAVFQVSSQSATSSQQSLGIRKEERDYYFGYMADTMPVVPQNQNTMPVVPQNQNTQTAQKPTNKPTQKPKGVVKTSKPLVGVARIYNDGSNCIQETQNLKHPEATVSGDGSARIFSSGKPLSYSSDEDTDEVARIYRNKENIVNEIMQETGCTDSNLVEEVYLNSGRHKQSAVDTVLRLMVEGDHIEDQFEDDQFEDQYLNDQAVEGQLVPGLNQPMVEDIDDSGRIWSVNGTGTRVFGNGEQDQQDHHSNLSKGARPKQRQLTAKEKKEQKKMEKKKRAGTRHKQSANREPYHDNPDHIDNQLGMLQI